MYRYQEPCRPKCPEKEVVETCGLEITIKASDCCCRVCDKLKYTITCVNNCSETLKEPRLTIAFPTQLCYQCNSLRVNGCVPKNDDLTCIELPEIKGGDTVIITYEATVMVTDRYVRTVACVDYRVCCCCETKCYRTTSCPNVVQVCGCCGQ